MKKITIVITGFLISFGIGFYINTINAKSPDKKIQSNVLIYNEEGNLKLGAFSVSLSVKDIKASKEFYESLGFTVFGGGLEQNYLIMKNENTLIGLFQGMFEGNILTFNPGWDENAKNIEKFDDVREIQRQLKNKGVTLFTEADEKTTGPASLMVTDPGWEYDLIRPASLKFMQIKK